MPWVETAPWWQPVPTVVTIHGGLYHALSVARHALFADPFDKEDLGITMVKIFRHEELRTRLSRLGAHKARSLFTWTGIAHQLVEVADAITSQADARQRTADGGQETDDRAA